MFQLISKGDLYFIEVILPFRNQDKSDVVALVLDTGSALTSLNMVSLRAPTPVIASEAKQSLGSGQAPRSNPNAIYVYREIATAPSGPRNDIYQHTGRTDID